VFLEERVAQNRVRDHAGVRHSGCLHQKPVVALPRIREQMQQAKEFLTGRAAGAALHSFHRPQVGAQHEMVVNRDFAQLIFDHRHPLAIHRCEQMVHQGRLSRTQKA